MKYVIEACVVGSILLWSATAQDPRPNFLRAGVSVQMAIAGGAVEMRAADEPTSTVVAVTADGKIFVGIRPVEPGELSSLTDETIYVKSDARASFQRVLAVLDALRGKSVVLLTATPENAVRQGTAAPYGMRLIVSR
jgi:hypothetical protein